MKKMNFYHLYGNFDRAEKSLFYKGPKEYNVLAAAEAGGREGGPRPEERRTETENPTGKVGDVSFQIINRNTLQEEGKKSIFPFEKKEEFTTQRSLIPGDISGHGGEKEKICRVGRKGRRSDGTD